MEESLQERRERLLKPVIQWLKDGAPHVKDKQIGAFDMSAGVDCDETKALAACGTTCCIAGAVCQFNEPFEITKSHAGWYNSPEWPEVASRARGLLGLRYREANLLFVTYSHDWLKVEPTEAAAVLENFLQTGEVDWEVTAVPARYRLESDNY